MADADHYLAEMNKRAASTAVGERRSPVKAAAAVPACPSG